MKRDMDLVRKILLAVEELPPTIVQPRTLSIPDASDPIVNEHVHLLDEAGLIEAIDASTRGSAAWIPMRLTWEGHEFLESMRNESVWNKAKSELASRGLGFSFDLMKAALLTAAKHLLSAA